MKKKINLQLMSITALTIIVTLILVSAVFYELFKKQVFEDLRIYAYVLADEQEESIIQPSKEVCGDLRITLLDAEGKVYYDSNFPVNEMENHLQRPEVQDAFQYGEGSIVRKSDTLDRNNYYYAVLLKNGCVLRVAREADNVFSFLRMTFPTLMPVVAFLLLACVALSTISTKSLLRPIEEIARDIDTKEEIHSYEELDPLIKTIRQQHEDIVKNAQMRQEFTANVSHELKTPLTSIYGYSELIENGMASGEDQVRFAGEIHKNAQRLLTLINDIIELSELDSHVQRRAFEKVDLYDLAGACVEMLQVQAEKHDVGLTLEGQSCFIMANRQLIEEVLYNLCDNAIRYNNPGGKVAVRIEKKETKILLVVEDNGIGISEEHQNRIFERFYRVDKSRSKSTGGTGLGLAIVKHIASEHGAEISLESEIGKGTKITVSFSACTDV